MWIVSLALRRPYTFIVLALLIALLGVFAILRMPTDIFPAIKIPVVSVVWRYSGLSPEEMEKRLVWDTSARPSAVNDIEHIGASRSPASAWSKYFFQPGAKKAATRRSPPISQTDLSIAPPGTTPPFIIRYSASNVPILQLASSEDLSEAQIFDLGQNFLRRRSPPSPGAKMPWPYGGKQRQDQIDIDPARSALRPLAARRDRRDRRAERDPPRRDGEDRRPRVLRRH